MESLSASGEFYTVRPFDGYCSCPHHRFRGAYCKHLKQVIALVANIYFEKAKCNNNFKGNEGLIVLTAVLRRWFDPRKKLKILTYRELGNEIEKLGFKLDKSQLSRVVSKFAETQVLKRTYLRLPGVEGKTLISVNQKVLNQFFDLDKQVIDSFTQSFKVELPENRTPFLKLDRVETPDIMLLNRDFTLTVNVNYYFPKPTDVRLDVQDAESHVTVSSLTVRLNGEDVKSIALTPEPLEKRAWIPQVQLYCLNGKEEWNLADYYLLGRRIYSPTIKINKNVEGLYEVESFSQPRKFYEVDSIRKRCTCPAYTYNHYCKHLQLIERL